MSKYIDLAEQIHAETRDQVYLDEIGEVLNWLDEHPDQVPGRTVMQSRYAAEGRDRSLTYMRGFDAALIELGATVIPDPEPTNTEKLADDIREVDGGHNLGAGVLAERLASLGWTKAPGAGES